MMPPRVMASGPKPCGGNKEFSIVLCEKPVILVELLQLELRIVVIQD